MRKTLGSSLTEFVMRLPITCIMKVLSVFAFLRAGLEWYATWKCCKAVEKEDVQKMIEAWKFNPRVDYPQVAAK